MNPTLSTLAQFLFLMPAQLVLRALDAVTPQPAGERRIRRRPGDLALCGLAVVGWLTLIAQAAQGVIGLP